MTLDGMLKWGFMDAYMLFPEAWSLWPSRIAILQNPGGCGLIKAGASYSIFCRMS